jgi:hypothetical protein
MKEYREGTRHKASMIKKAKLLCALAQPEVVCDGVIDLNKVLFTNFYNSFTSEFSFRTHSPT